MTEIEILQKELADAKVEIRDLTIRLKNAELLCWQLSSEDPKSSRNQPQK